MFYRIYGAPQAEAILKTYDGGFAMLAFPLPDAIANQLQKDADEYIPNAFQKIEANRFHITLLAFGETKNLEKFPIHLAISTFANITKPISAKLQGIGIFHKEEEDVIYATLDSQEINEFQEKAKRYFANAGIPWETNHGFTPHITLAYCKPGTAIHSGMLELNGESFALEHVVLGWDQSWEYYLLRGGSITSS